MKIYDHRHTDDTTHQSASLSLCQRAASCCRSYWLCCACLALTFTHLVSSVFRLPFFFVSLASYFSFFGFCRCVAFILNWKTVTSLAGRIAVVVVAVVAAASDDKTSVKHVSCRARNRISHSRLGAH